MKINGTLRALIFLPVVAADFNLSVGYRQEPVELGAGDADCNASQSNVKFYRRSQVQPSSLAAPESAMSAVLPTHIQLDDRGVPPGEYGLKAGHDGYQDPEVPRGREIEDPEHKAYKQEAQPWKSAVVVQVVSGQTLEGVEIACPAAVASGEDRAAGD